jgi:penicillin-binding protein 1C
MLRIFKQAGIPRRTPPARDPRCGIDVVAGRGNPPQITSPTGGVSYVLRAFKTEEKGIPFRATTDADAKEVFWFVNETFVGKAPSGKVFLWSAQPGSFVVRAVDDRGRAGSREIAVTVAR